MPNSKRKTNEKEAHFLDIVHITFDDVEADDWHITFDFIETDDDNDE